MISLLLEKNVSTHCGPLRPPGPSSVTLLKKYGPEVPFLPLIKVIVMPDAQSQPTTVTKYL